MKLAEKILEFEIPNNFDKAKALNALNAQIEFLGYSGVIQATDVERDSSGTEFVITDSEGNELEVSFSVGWEDDEFTPFASVYAETEDGEGDFRIIYLPSNIPMVQTKMLGDFYEINTNDFSWVDEETLFRILDGENEEDFDDDFDEAFTYVIRDGKKVKKKLVRQKRRKRLTAKQKQGIRKGVRSRRAKKGQIARKRKKSLKIRGRKNLKRNTNKRMKVAGTSSRKR